jgi:hypothetical protein
MSDLAPYHHAYRTDSFYHVCPLHHAEQQKFVCDSSYRGGVHFPCTDCADSKCSVIVLPRSDCLLVNITVGHKQLPHPAVKVKTAECKVVPFLE